MEDQTVYKLFFFGVGTDYEWMEHDIEFKKLKDVKKFVADHMMDYVEYKIKKSTLTTIKHYKPEIKYLS